MRGYWGLLGTMASIRKNVYQALLGCPGSFGYVGPLGTLDFGILVRLCARYSVQDTEPTRGGASMVQKRYRIQDVWMPPAKSVQKYESTSV